MSVAAAPRELVLDCLLRLGQLDLLDHVGGEERHALALQLVSHG
jgi:hypothetical protein